MTLKLISHVNNDSDLIEAWLKYYSRLGIDQFHLIIHGASTENEKLLTIANDYPVTIEDTYQGPFKCEEKKNRLDAVLARCADQWVVLVDSDEFVEFPYADIPETIRMLSLANANLMAAPMLQRMKSDGSLDTPFLIDDPFEVFPLCSVDLYRRMGIKGDIFKFPLFYCASGTRVLEEGNHHPPLGCEPRASGMLGVTHHFKFRRTVSQRIENMICSEHPWRHESVQLREYLDNHSNRLPLEGTFVYSRDELFRRRLLRKLPASTSVLSAVDPQATTSSRIPEVPKDRRTEAQKAGNQAVSGFREHGRNILFVLPKTAEFGGLEKHLFALLQGLKGEVQRPVIACFGQETISDYMDDDLRASTTVRCMPEPKTFGDWFQLIRRIRPDVIVFCYNWFRSFPWQAPLASLVAVVPRRVSIQHLLPLPPPPVDGGKSLKAKLRRRIGARARDLFKVRLTGHICQKTICVSNAVRNSLVREYQFPARKTITIHNGISTSAFVPSKRMRIAVRARLDVSEEDFLLVCAARLTEVKGIDIVIPAVSRVNRQGVSCKCIILGEGPLKEKLQKQANSLGLSGHVFFEGFQTDVRPYFQAASAFILTSYIEGLPLSILEAMACGLPCIVTDVGGNAEAVTDRVTGLVISAGSLDEAENAILYLATHPHECAEMATRARETVRRSFDIDNKIEELKVAILH